MYAITSQATTSANNPLDAPPQTSEKTGVQAWKFFTCEKCGKGYSYLSNARNHALQRHKEKSPFIFISRKRDGRLFPAIPVKSLKNPTCKVCNKVFRSKGSLKTHTEKHEGKIFFQSSCCGKLSKDYSTIYKHTKNSQIECKHGTTRKIDLTENPHITIIKKDGNYCFQVKHLDLPMPKNNKTTQPNPEGSTKRKHENDGANTELDSKKSKFTTEEIDAANILCGMRNALNYNISLEPVHNLFNNITKKAKTVN